MRFDGPDLAHAFLAVMAATGDDKLLPTTFKTIALEEHLHGVRLVATDRRLLLTAYVPDLDSHYDSPPSPDIAPERIHVVTDRKGRARSLMAYVCALAVETDPEDYTPGDIEVRIDFKMPATKTRGSGPVQPTLEGMDPDVCTISVPGKERLHVEIVTDSFPDWRVVARHASKRTLGALLPPEQLEKLARIRKHARGPLEVTMGEHTALVTYPQSDPAIAGVLVLADPDDPDVYQGDQETAGDQVKCPRCDYAADASEDGDGAISDVRNHMSSRHQVHEATTALREIHGLEPIDDPDQITVDEALADLEPDEWRQSWDDECRADEKRLADAAAEQTPATAPDVMLTDAARLTVSTQLGSAAQLQRTLRIGQARAARLMDELERRGIVGPADPDSGKSRTVLLKGDQVDQAIEACR